MNLAIKRQLAQGLWGVVAVNDQPSPLPGRMLRFDRASEASKPPPSYAGDASRTSDERASAVTTPRTIGEGPPDDRLHAGRLASTTISGGEYRLLPASFGVPSDQRRKRARTSSIGRSERKEDELSRRFGHEATPLPGKTLIHDPEVLLLDEPASGWIPWPASNFGN